MQYRRGLRFFCIDTHRRFFVPLPVALAADLKEAGKLFGVRPYPSDRCDINTLTRLRDMNGRPGPARTEDGMRQVHATSVSLVDRILGRQVAAKSPEDVKFGSIFVPCCGTSNREAFLPLTQTVSAGD